MITNIIRYHTAVYWTRGVKLAAIGAFQCGPRDDSEITNEFRQHCNGSLSNKRLKLWSQATLERYKFLSFGDNFTDTGKMTTCFFLEIDFTSGSITEIVAQRIGDLQIQNFMRPSAWLLIYAMWLPEAHEFDTPVLNHINNPRPVSTLFGLIRRV